MFSKDVLQIIQRPQFHCSYKYYVNWNLTFFKANQNILGHKKCSHYCAHEF